jgi:hypothetical protein
MTWQVGVGADILYPSGHYAVAGKAVSAIGEDTAAYRSPWHAKREARLVSLVSPHPPLCHPLSSHPLSPSTTPHRTSLSQPHSPHFPPARLRTTRHLRCRQVALFRGRPNSHSRSRFALARLAVEGDRKQRALFDIGFVFCARTTLDRATSLVHIRTHFCREASLVHPRICHGWRGCSGHVLTGTLPRADDVADIARFDPFIKDIPEAMRAAVRPLPTLPVMTMADHLRTKYPSPSPSPSPSPKIER